MRTICQTENIEILSVRFTVYIMLNIRCLEDNGITPDITLVVLLCFSIELSTIEKQNEVRAIKEKKSFEFELELEEFQFLNSKHISLKDVSIKSIADINRYH